MRVPLTQGYFAEVDAADFPKVEGFKWGVFKSKRSRTLYAKAKRHGPLMHRLLLGCVPGDGRWVDHVDRNGLNNTRENLRISTGSQNIANSQKRNGTSSSFKGVYLNRDSNKWVAKISRKENGGRRFYSLGRFTSQEDAARAYDAKASELFGEFAGLNFPESRLFFGPNSDMGSITHKTVGETL